MSSHSEVEIKFAVPVEAKAAVAAEVARGSAVEHRILAAKYLDTSDRRLARAGIAWRVRREGRRWIQALKAGSGALERFEHEVVRTDGSHDAAAHGETVVGQKLDRILRQARADGFEVGVRFQTQIRRSARRIRTRGAVVEVAFDDGRLVAGTSRERVLEVEFELVSGSTVSMLALAERWRKRFGLLYEPRSKSERGDRLAEDLPLAPIRKARRPEYPRHASTAEAFGAVLDECLSHVSRSASGVVAGDRSLRVEHVHQLRVGIRRLRSGLRSFSGWLPPPPEAMVEGLRGLFATLGQSRDGDVLGAGVVAALEKAGAPALAVPAGASGPDPVAAVRAPETQRLLLGWLTWRAGLAEGLADPAAPNPAVTDSSAMDPGVTDPGATDPGVTESGMTDSAIADSAVRDVAVRAPSVRDPAVTDSAVKVPLPADGLDRPPGTGGDQAPPGPDDGRATFRRDAERRLRRWHRRIAADWKRFDDLDEESLHALRKRIKRQRYAVEFFAPVLRDGRTRRYLKPLTSIQDRMGELNDLFVARTRYRELVASDPAAWFALGWIEARVTVLRALAKPELKRLAKADPPGR